MNILFVTYAHLDSNGGVHVFNLANQLIELGHDCAVCVPDQPEATARVGSARFATIHVAQVLDRPHRFADGRAADLIHAWTPREIVRRTVDRLRQQHACPYLVHLEDNEAYLTEVMTGRSAAQLRGANPDQLDDLIPLHASHPIRARGLLAGAAGVTALLDTLLTLKPEDVPGCVIWPACEDGFAHACDAADGGGRRARLGIGEGEYVIAYTGNVHAGNRREVRSLYIAVALLNQQGLPTRLVRTGVDHVPLFDTDERAAVDRHCVELGFRPRAEIPGVLAMADALVQPGRADRFNEFRFPSKLPEYFASGKAALIPNANLARFVRDGIDCIVLKEGHGAEIARVLRRLLPDVTRREALGRQAREFAAVNFSWRRSAERLAGFYAEIMARPVAPSALETGRRSSLQSS